jgi:hypothetical protein
MPGINNGDAAVYGPTLMPSSGTPSRIALL